SRRHKQAAARNGVRARVPEVRSDQQNGAAIMSTLPTVRVRASSLGELFDCPSRWYAKNVLGLRTPTSFKARLGTAVHAGTAAFDAARLEGNPITPDDAAGALVDALYRDRTEDGQEDAVDWEGEN